MKVFLLDILHDLRQKRMLPAALVLLALIAAVPLVVAKSAEVPAPSTGGSSTPAQPKSALSVVDANQPVSPSALRAFSKEDPFKPLDTPGQPTETGAFGSPLDAGTGTPAAGEAPRGGSGGSGDSGGSGGGTDGGGGGSNGGSDGGSDDNTTTTTTAYRYTLDLTYTHGENVRTVKGMEKLGVLPNKERTLFIYSGVSTAGGNAIFLIDASLKAVGEGACKPSAAQCAYLYLGAGSVHQFTDDRGEKYSLRIDQINRIAVKSTKVASGSSQSSGRR